MSKRAIPRMRYIWPWILSTAVAIFIAFRDRSAVNLSLAFILLFWTTLYLGVLLEHYVREGDRVRAEYDAAVADDPQAVIDA